jgi:proline dehydrogenase
MLDRLLGYGSYVEIATHDEWLVAEALDLLHRHGRTPDEYEFQMLLGVREDLGDVLVADGHRLRVYVPFGEEWHGYCVRRLKESPDVAKHVIRASASRLLRR